MLSLTDTTAHPMRWCLFIPNLLVLLTLGLEPCCGCGTAGVQDASHLVCVLGGNEAELQQDLTAADWVMPLRGADNWEVDTGIRRHRWLCQERC